MAAVDLTTRLLARAVAGLGGEPRPGQQQMAAAISASVAARRQLLVQAGTGTGKSLAYLAAVAAYLQQHPTSRVVVATATLALQTQLATKDVPTITAALLAETGHELSWCLLKGRSNYACLLKIRDRVGLEFQEELLGGAELTQTLKAAGADATSVLGAEVIALRGWAEAELTADSDGDRDRAPDHSARAWAQVSSSSWDCIGQASCPYHDECFAEAARDRARASQLVITNHALVAVDAETPGSGLPDHDLAVFDEAHELPARVTGAATTELSPQQVERVTKRVAPYLSEASEELLQAAGLHLRIALDQASPGRVSGDDPLLEACAELRSALRQAISGLGSDKSDPAKIQAGKQLRELFEVAERLAAASEADVIWVSERELFGAQLVVAPLSVAPLIRHRILAPRPSILTSATLTLGGDFSATAISLGLRPAERDEVAEEGQPVDPGLDQVPDDNIDSATPFHSAQNDGKRVHPVPNDGEDHSTSTDGEEVHSVKNDGEEVHFVQNDGEEVQNDSKEETRHAARSRSIQTGIKSISTDNIDSQTTPTGSEPDRPLPWSALDVGSPFDYPRQGIAYVARQLPPPGRDGISEAALEEVAALVEASRGSALGLFSSLRAAQEAAAWVRASRDLPVLCQGEGHLPELVRRFVADPQLSLFGTLSLWQGVDAPGATCRLVIIDRIPFPRPNEPLSQARQLDVSKHGGNGFMTIAAGQAALLLAQGSGRLIRSTQDRGVVALLDSRLATARYAPYLLKSLPPLWLTKDRAVVLAALSRLSDPAPE